MIRAKVYSYLGFAARSGNLAAGTNHCIAQMERQKIRLLILAGDLAENTQKKLSQLCDRKHIAYRIFGESESLAHATGQYGKGVFGITDGHFAEIICKEIDLMRSEKEVSE